MTRIYGSDDLFPDTLSSAYRAHQSVNFITSHDGFCLYDLVSYQTKRNHSNTHNNTDGTDHNLSWNCGWDGDEGVPDDVFALRKQQIKNFCCLLLLSNGTPMFCAGDEFMRTQQGNNNPYNQDNETSWMNWDLLHKNSDMFRFFQKDDRIPESASVDLPEPILAGGCAVVWRWIPRRPVLQFAHAGLACTAARKMTATSTS